MERVLPLVAQHGAAVVAISNDETGITEDPDVRFEVARQDRLARRRPRHPARGRRGRPARDADRRDGHAGRQVFRLVRRLREELGVNTTCGASNVSFGLPNRTGLNAAFLPMAIASGMTSAITSPLHDGDAPGRQGGRRDDGQRRALRGVDRAARGQRPRPRRRGRPRGRAARRSAAGGIGARGAADGRGARR